MSLSSTQQNKMVLNKRVQGTRHKVSGPLTRDVGRKEIHMKLINLLFMVAIATSTSYAQTQEDMTAAQVESRTIHLIGVNQSNEPNLVYEAKVETIRNSPDWNGIGEPPLGIAKATDAAIKYFIPKYPDAQYDVDAVLLQRIPSINTINRWFYKIDIRYAVIINGAITPKSTSVIMLLDGNIIEPRISNE